ncbi:UNKNOWN [Stylonychia lemnae]|uniref:VWFA domain-containing protein n=1 Tax=Stylonychia lemnae TaxID=5949 RepID=A0A078AXK5_STYLE|nr:UNKNOWN [Stylonychia lemnae]|eukprot:CDW86874.1 UNKNOWN [Stylonychia lemnae]
MNRIRLGILFIFSLASITLAQTSQQCKECAADPCGCSLFKCSKKQQFPVDAQDLTKGFSGCQETNGKLYDGDIIQQLQGSCYCPYMLIDENCQPIGQSGIILGSGFDITGDNSENLKKLDAKLLEKLSPYFVKYENPLQFLMNNRLELSQQEIQSFDQVKLDNEIQNLEKYYNANLFNNNKLGKLSKDKPKFAQLTRGVRTVIFSQNRQYGKPDNVNFNEMWNLALRTDFQNMLDSLNKEGQQKVRSLQEYQILKYCMEKCSQSKKVNILFVMDGSGSINEQNFKIQTDFVRILVQDTKLGDDSYQIGLLAFATKNDLLSDFSSDQAALIKALNEFEYPDGDTFTNTALIEAKRLFQVQSAKRPDSMNLMFIITDGEPTKGDEVVDSTIQALNDLKVQRYAIGITKYIKYNTLMYLSGDNKQDSSRVYYVTDFSKLQYIINSINVAACSTPQEIKPSQQQFETTLDGQGSQYLKLQQKYVSLNIDVQDSAKLQSLFSQNSLILLANEDQNVNILDDVVVYYSYTYDLPNQYINDGSGQQKDGKIQLIINNSKTSISNIFTIYKIINSICIIDEKEYWKDKSLCQAREFVSRAM